MPLWIDDALLVIALLSVAIFFFGIFRFIFKRGKRKAGAKLSGLSVIVFLVSIIGFGSVNDALLAKSGFDSQATYNEAASFGVYDSTEWEVQEDALREVRRLEEERQASEREAERSAAAAETEDNRRRGFHCLSGWDGSHTGFKRQVTSMMRNPSSFEHISTRVTPVNAEGVHTVLMEYRAENGFGGMSVGSAVGEFSNANCDSFAVLSTD
jgi:hypothetical protein